MDIVIENNIAVSVRKFDFRKNIEYLLQLVPKEHIYKINKIIVTNKASEKHMKNAAGFYYGYQDYKQINIVLGISGMFPKMPTIFFKLFPIIPKYLLARTLYHEIGHHYQNINHGYRKDVWEKTAEKYSEEMTKRFLLSSRISKLLKLFKFILVPVLKVYKNREK